MNVRSVKELCSSVSQTYTTRGGADVISATLLEICSECFILQ